MYFLYHKKSKPTGEKIGLSLLGEHGEKVNYAFYDSLIRWGSRKDPHLDSSFENVLNREEAIAKASDKLMSLEIISEHFQQNDVPGFTPDFDVDPNALIERVGYPILGRKRYHARGTDIKLCLQRKDFRNPMDYYVQYIPTVREFRIHVVRDEVIRVQGKFLDEPSQALPWLRNYSTGHRFRNPKKRLKPDRLMVTIEAVKSLGLDFGAVDFLITDEGESCVLEVNTAPSCSPLTATQYVLAFQKLLNIPSIDVSHLDLLSPEEEVDSEDEVQDEIDEEIEEENPYINYRELTLEDFLEVGKVKKKKKKRKKKKNR